MPCDIRRNNGGFAVCDMLLPTKKNCLTPSSRFVPRGVPSAMRNSSGVLLSFVLVCLVPATSCASHAPWMRSRASTMVFSNWAASTGSFSWKAFFTYTIFHKYTFLRTTCMKEIFVPYIIGDSSLPVCVSVADDRTDHLINTLRKPSLRFRIGQRLIDHSRAKMH